ncbi:MAG: ABC transporter ATP-binding protein [Acetobacteraceae bacterium]|nr:MAG: ABC transporter ATP-binding protein [Acetobacteraceae bacterium]
MKHALDAGLQSLNQASVEDLNAALRIFRRLPLELLGFLVLLPVSILGLSRLSTALAPPYGVYIFGQGLVTWGLLLLIALLFGLFWWRGRQVGRLLNEPALVASPITGLLSGTSILAEKASAMGMEWSGFYGPLRSRRSKTSS